MSSPSEMLLDALSLIFSGPVEPLSFVLDGDTAEAPPETVSVKMTLEDGTELHFAEAPVIYGRIDQTPYVPASVDYRETWKHPPQVDGPYERG